MCTTGHDQQCRPYGRVLGLLAHTVAGSRERFKDQRVGDGSNGASQMLSGSPCRGHRLIEYAHPTGQPSSLQNLAHSIAVWVHRRYRPSHAADFLNKQKDPVIATGSLVLSAL